MASIIELPQLTVRQGGPEDVVAATQLVYRVWHDTYDPHLPSPMCAMKSEGSFRAHIAKRIRKAWLAFYGDELVGYCCAVTNCIDDIWVDPRYRRRGIGSRLLEQATAGIREKGYQNVQVGCEDFNEGARAFFQHHHWQVIGSASERLAPGHVVEAMVYSCRVG